MNLNNNNSDKDTVIQSKDRKDVIVDFDALLSFDIDLIEVDHSARKDAQTVKSDDNFGAFPALLQSPAAMRPVRVAPARPPPKIPIHEDADEVRVNMGTSREPEPKRGKPDLKEQFISMLPAWLLEWLSNVSDLAKSDAFSKKALQLRTTISSYAKPLKIGRWEVYNRAKEIRTPTFYLLITGAVVLIGTSIGIMSWALTASKSSSSKSIAVINSALVLQNSTGTGVAGYQDGEGSTASFNAPNGVAADSDGNIYVSDTGNNVVRKINVTGYVSTLVGNAHTPASFRDGQGSDALFNAPIGITLDSSTGLLFVVDSNNSLIRQINLENNAVITIAGDITLQTGSLDGQSTSSSFNNPYGIAIDSNQNLYISDTGNDLVRQINSSRYCSTFAGISTLSRRISSALSTRLKSPLGVAVDYKGSIYVVDSGNLQIIKIDPNSISKVMDLTSVSPAAIAVDKNNSLWVSHSDSSVLQVVSSAGSVQTIQAPSNSLSFLTFKSNGDVVSSSSSMNVISEFVVVASSPSSSTLDSTQGAPESSTTVSTTSTSSSTPPTPSNPTSYITSITTGVSAESAMTTIQSSSSSISNFSSSTGGVVTTVYNTTLKITSLTGTSTAFITSTKFSSSVTLSTSSATSSALPGSPSLTWITSIQAGSVIAGNNFSTQPVLRLTDQNRVAVSSAIINLLLFADSSCSSSTGSAGLTGNTATTNSSGFATFSAFRATIARSYYVMASYNGLNSSCSTQALNVTASSLANLTFSTQPSGTVAAGSPITTQPVVLALDAYGNAVSTLVTLSAWLNSGCTTSASGAVSSGTIATNPSGYAVFSAVSYNRAQTVYIKATNNSVSTCSTSSVFVSAAAASVLSWITSIQAGSVVAGLRFSTQPVFLLTDQYGDAINGALITLSLFRDSSCLNSAGSVGLTGYTASTNSSGYASFSVFNATTVGSYYVMAFNGGINSPCSTRALNVTVASLASLSFSTQPSGTAVAGSIFSTQPIVLALDADSSCVTSAGTVGLTGNTATTNSSGCASFTAFNSTTAGTYYVKSFNGGVNSSCSTQSLSVTAASLSSLSFTTQPSGSVAAGSAFTTQPIVLALDSYGNAVSASITITPFLNSGCTTTASGTVSGGTLLTNSSGYAVFSGVYYNRAQTIYVKATNNSVSVCSTSTVVVSAASAAILSWISTIQTGSVVAGNLFSTQPALSLTDVYGDFINAASISLSLFTDSGCSASAGSVGLSGNTATTNSSGIVSFSTFKATSVGTYYVMAFNGGLSSSCSTQALSVTEASLASISFSTQPSGSAAAGSAFSTPPIVQALDIYGNAISSVSITLSPFLNNACTISGSGVLSSNTSSTNSTTGGASFASLYYNRIETIYLLASGGSFTACSSSSVAVSAGNPSSLSWTTTMQAESVVAGNAYPTQPVLVLLDQFGNAVSSASVSLSLYSNIGCSTVWGSWSGNTATTDSSGRATFTSFGGTTVGTYYVKATYGGLSSSCSTMSVSVTAASSYTTSFYTQPSSSSTKNTAFSTTPVVYSSDAYGNAVSVTLSAFTDSGCTTAALGTLSITTPSSGAYGYFDFASLSYSGVGTIYLKADSGATFACSTSVGISVTVSTLAGSGTAGSANGVGTGATFYNPAGVAVDTSGNVYVADYNNHRIRKITSGGTVTTFAGSSLGYFNSVTGTNAQFYNPLSVAVTSSGIVYVADSGNSVIRKITSGGAVTLHAGNSITAGFADGTGSAAQFDYPYAVAVDSSGVVYVADTYNHRIRKISTCGAVTTLAGSAFSGYADGVGSAAAFNYPSGVAVDSSGNVYVGDTTNDYIRKITSGGSVSTLAGIGHASASIVNGAGNVATFKTPQGVAVDSSGNVYVADFYQLIRMITPGGIVSTYAGTGSTGSADGAGTAASFSSPYSVAVDSSGNVYVADYNNHKIRKIS